MQFWFWSTKSTWDSKIEKERNSVFRSMRYSRLPLPRRPEAVLLLSLAILSVRCCFFTVSLLLRCSSLRILSLVCRFASLKEFDELHPMMTTTGLLSFFPVSFFAWLDEDLLLMSSSSFKTSLMPKQHVFLLSSDHWSWRSRDIPGLVVNLPCLLLPQLQLVFSLSMLIRGQVMSPSKESSSKDDAPFLEKTLIPEQMINGVIYLGRHSTVVGFFFYSLRGYFKAPCFARPFSSF